MSAPEDATPYEFKSGARVFFSTSNDGDNSPLHTRGKIMIEIDALCSDMGEDKTHKLLSNFGGSITSACQTHKLSFKGSFSPELYNDGIFVYTYEITSPVAMTPDDFQNKLKEVYTAAIGIYDQTQVAKLQKKNNERANQLIDSFSDILEAYPVLGDDRPKIVAALTKAAMEIVSKKRGR
ncbi:MAG: hypothetical protein KGI29_04535 [Pseudomonadota bacterium]|nr:hypothetical protein [Pseudomonadota bacterium]MDE3037315.1 hypothetical protein [Pseudomonadota bacterium]